MLHHYIDLPLAFPNSFSFCFLIFIVRHVDGIYLTITDILSTQFLCLGCRRRNKRYPAVPAGNQCAGSFQMRLDVPGGHRRLPLP